MRAVLSLLSNCKAGVKSQMVLNGYGNEALRVKEVANNWLAIGDM